MFHEWVNEVQFNHWDFYIGEDYKSAGAIAQRYYLQVQFRAPDNSTPHDLTLRTQAGRKFWLSEHMTKTEFIQTCLLAVLAAVEHEAREQFLYRGQPVFRPHHNIDDLHSMVEACPPDSRA